MATAVRIAAFALIVWVVGLSLLGVYFAASFLLWPKRMSGNASARMLCEDALARRRQTERFWLEMSPRPTGDVLACWIVERKSVPR